MVQAGVERGGDGTIDLKKIKTGQWVVRIQRGNPVESSPKSAEKMMS